MPSGFDSFLDKSGLSYLWGKIVNQADPLRAYPVGSIYMSVNSTSPATIFGGTWERIEGTFLLAATDNGSSGAAQAAGNTGGAASVTLTGAQSGLPAHSHGLNSHKHSVGAHSHGLNSHKHSVGAHSHGLNSHKHSVGAHAHTVPQHGHGHTNPSVTGGSHGHNTVLSVVSNGTGTTGNGPNYTNYVALKFNASWQRYEPYTTDTSHSHTVSGGGVSDKAAFNTNNSTAFDSGAASGSTANSSAFDTGAASGSTANSSAFDSGAASGDTASNTAASATEAHDNMPPYLSVYMWKRTA